MPSKTRKFVASSGFGPSHNLGVYNCNVDTIERAFVERYFLCKDGESFRPAFDVKPQAYAGGWFKEFRSAVTEDMPSLPRLTRQQVVDRYNGPKRRVYEAAHASLCKQPLNETDARLTSFVKFEKQDVHKAPHPLGETLLDDIALTRTRLPKWMRWAFEVEGLRETTRAC